MIQMNLFIIIITLIPLLLMFLNILITKSSFNDREKISPFECGFDPISHNHIPFSIHFFIISLIFLIFDIEITMLIPFIYLLTNFNLPMILMFFLFLSILMVSLYFEYLEQSIDWKI
uniref:NADH-ubiquinone oxidoreductase chain 3 n=1 Tax=Pristomyrmex punctatus TaxID=507543 RepID=E5RQ00_9HYME|nr:NADH dehydrogenase subunit 3 [Pristomyrmex punctatus]BAJ53353.1 NADH dehydrogenase subunit 3 [Pristomyrmex punctatus]BAJ53366.1 NADH dehydrogenase subunit 3 [Pristomyrmex punctatus]